MPEPVITRSAGHGLHRARSFRVGRRDEESVVLPSEMPIIQVAHESPSARRPFTMKYLKSQAIPCALPNIEN